MVIAFAISSAPASALGSVCESRGAANQRVEASVGFVMDAEKANNRGAHGGAIACGENAGALGGDAHQQPELERS